MTLAQSKNEPTNPTAATRERACRAIGVRLGLDQQLDTVPPLRVHTLYAWSDNTPSLSHTTTMYSLTQAPRQVARQ